MGKKKKRRSRQITIPLAVVAPVAYAVGEPVVWGLQGMPWDEVLKHLAYRFTPVNPWNGQFDMGGIWKGLIPVIAGGLVHKFVGPYVNRALGRAKVPFIRV